MQAEFKQLCKCLTCTCTFFKNIDLKVTQNKILFNKTIGTNIESQLHESFKFNIITY